MLITAIEEFEMQRTFEKFRDEAEILATESNAEVEIIVKYSFKKKPKMPAFADERSGYGIKLESRETLFQTAELMWNKIPDSWLTIMFVC